MCVWQSINPGRTVARERSMTVAPGGIADEAAAETLSIRLPRTTITWSRRGALAFPSIRTPARMTVTGDWDWPAATGARRSESATSVILSEAKDLNLYRIALQ